MTKLLSIGAAWVNVALKPFGLILWLEYDVDMGPDGFPVSMRVCGAKLGRRPW